MKQDLTIEDVIEMGPRERDRLVSAHFLFDLKEDDLDDSIATFKVWHWDNGNDTWPKYSEKWFYAGRVLEALPVSFGQYPPNLFHAIGRPEICSDSPLSKKSIVLAACICAVKGIEPEGIE